MTDPLTVLREGAAALAKKVGIGGSDAPTAGEGAPPPEEQKKADPNETVSGDAAAANQNIINEQAALMLNADLILEAVKKSNASRREFIKYKYFTTMRDPNNSATTTDYYDITSLLTKNPSLQKFFNKVPTQFLSILQPSIKLYKIFYPAEALKTSQTQPGKAVAGYDWRIPFDDVSIGVKNNNDESSEFVNYTLDQLMSGQGRLNGVGIKSFSYSYKGVNPAEINTNIVANLELYIQSPDDLIKTIEIQNDDPRFIQQSDKIQLQKGMTFNYADLVNLSSRFIPDAFTESGDLVVNAHYYRIKAVIGYETPPDSYFKNLNVSDEEKNELLLAIKTCKVILLLTPFSHDLSFNENGNMTMKIEYHASIDKILTSEEADVFKISDSYRAFLSSKDNYRKTLKQKQISIKKLRCNNRVPTDKEREDVENKYKGKLEEAQKLFFEARRDMYSSLYKELLRLNSSDSWTGIFSVKLHRTAVGVLSQDQEGFRKSIAGAVGTALGAGGPLISRLIYSSFIFNNALEAADIVRIQNLTLSRKVYDISLLSTNEDAIALLKKDVEQPFGLDRGIFSLGTGDAPAAKKLAEELAKRKEENKTLDVDGEFVNVKFIFLGDILDVALRSLYNITPYNDIPKIILGNIEIEVPTDFTGTGNSTETLTETKKINIADIPIAYSNLYSFLIDKIVRQDRGNYPVLNFIKDIITELVVPSVSPKKFGTSSKINTSIRLSSLHLAIPLDANGADVIVKTNNTPIVGSYFTNPTGLDPINISSINKDELLKKSAVDVETQLSKGVSSYFFIYCSTQFNTEKNVGDEDKDVKNGIYHIRIGTDSGIIKKVAFSKVDAPFMREAVAAQEGKNNVSMIKQIYDVKIDMFGNNIYRPGDIIYVEPYISFLKEQEQVSYVNQAGSVVPLPPKVVDLQDRVGIGGYYMIKEVQTNINENVFTTTIDAVFKAHKYVPGRDQDKKC